MKKQIFTLSFALCAAFMYSQNSNPYPTSGFLGLGTGAPICALDVVRSPLTIPGNSTTNMTYVGYKPPVIIVGDPSPRTGIYVQDVTYASPAVRATKITSVTADASAGYIEFNAPQTSNTMRAAVTLGYNNTEALRINQDGKVRIGSPSSNLKTPNGFKLFVEQGILTEQVKVAVKNATNWADYVFEPDYKLMQLEEVADYIKKNNHLPNVPSATEMVKNGLNVAEMDAKLLEKIEELTLYAVQQKDEAKELKAELEKQKKEVEELKTLLKTLTAKN